MKARLAEHDQCSVYVVPVNVRRTAVDVAAESAALEECGLDEVLVVVRVDSPYVDKLAPDRFIIQELFRRVRLRGAIPYLYISTSDDVLNIAQTLYSLPSVDPSNFKVRNIRILDKTGRECTVKAFEEVLECSIFILRPRTDDVFVFAGALVQHALSALHPEDLGKFLGSIGVAHINVFLAMPYLRPRLLLVDAEYILEGDAPYLGKERRWGYIFLSRDHVALDTAILRFLGVDLREVPYLEIITRICGGHVCNTRLCGERPGELRIAKHRFSRNVVRYGGLEVLMSKLREYPGHATLCKAIINRFPY